MLERTIKQIITKKMRDWIASIKDEKVRGLVSENTVLTGGCFTSFLQNEEPNDYDVYFRDKETVLAVANYYAKKWEKIQSKKGNNTILQVLDCDSLIGMPEGDERKKFDPTVNSMYEGRVFLLMKSKGVEGDLEAVNADEELGMSVQQTVEELDEIKLEEIEKQEKKPYKPVFISSNAITLSGGIQIVCRFYGEPETIHDTYDFEHTKAYWTSWDKEVVIPKIVYEMVANKVLRYTGSKYPVCSLFRLRKFINRGWSINAGQVLKIAMQVSELDLMDINVLEDQLIGVDSLYFMNLIEQFRRKKEKDENFVLTSNYIVSIIDKIF